MRIKLTLPDVPDSLNKIFSMHWSGRKKLQSYWDGLVLAAWHKCDRIMFVNPVVVTFFVTFTTSRARDYDNYLGGTKFITDALKRTFFIKDDAEWLKDIRVVFRKGDVQQTEVLIEEAQ